MEIKVNLPEINEISRFEHDPAPPFTTPKWKNSQIILRRDVKCLDISIVIGPVSASLALTSRTERLAQTQQQQQLLGL